jgi:hypothetical protein
VLGGEQHENHGDDKSGLRLDKPDLVEAALVRKPGVDLGLFDELVYEVGPFVTLSTFLTT